MKRPPTLKQNFKRRECLVEWQEQILSFKSKNWTDEQILIGINIGNDKFTMTDLKNFYKRVGLADTEKKEEVASQEQTTEATEEVTAEEIVARNTEKEEETRDSLEVMSD